MLTQLLTSWIAGQRWFAGKGRPIDDLTVDTFAELESGDPKLVHAVVSVRQGDRRTRYQLLLGERYELPHRLQHVMIGQLDGRFVYDAAHDSDLTPRLLEHMNADAMSGELAFRRVPGADIDPTLRSLVMTAEQSNTSIVFGDRYILKVFRALIPGLNPELEVVTALAAAQSSHVARPFGWIEMPVDGVPTTLAIMQEFLSNASEGWSMALASVRDLYACEPGMRAEDAGGDFAAESFRLGVATAHVHKELATAFPTGVVEPPEVKRMAERFRRRLERAVEEVPELAAHADIAHEAYDRLADTDRTVPVQRVHGDYHLGQVVRATHDWIVLDFEGEPGQPLAQRRALDSPLRDVAGMLRSFEYAARHLLADHADPAALERCSEEWAARNRRAFLDGYAEGGGRISGADAVLLRALELCKAVYEVTYEARNRPSWLPIPLAAFRT
ncbi:aminoglycoside phosphotransferase [Streptosporangiaceae bacterium NEAU-GS5]|nr:aminoglycoside phosphotransferase [Streptosporangiaceae bacterium NEAU-GS5]